MLIFLHSGGVNLNCKVTPSKTEEGVYECLYIPPKVGQYVINITFGGQHITKSPFRVDVGPEKFTKIVAFGPGLEGGVVNQPACFTVETNGEVGALGECYTEHVLIAVIYCEKSICMCLDVYIRTHLCLSKTANI